MRQRNRNKTPGDGDCFFHSYLKATEKDWDGLNGAERRKRAHELRTALIKYVGNHWGSLPLTMTNETKNGYMKRMQKGCSDDTDTWATELEIDAMARMQKRRISVESDGKGKLQRFPVGDETTFSPTLPEVAIKHLDGNHFDTDQNPATQVAPISKVGDTSTTANQGTTNRQTATQQTSKPVAQSTAQVTSTTATGNNTASNRQTTTGNKPKPKKRTYWGTDLAAEDLQTVGVFAFLGAAVLSVVSAGAAMMRV